MDLERSGSNAISNHVVEDSKLYCHTVFHDDSALNQNERIRNSGMLEKAQLGLHDDEDVRMVISCPSTLQWAVFKRKHGETYRLIKSADEGERIQGARQLQLLHPDWVVQSRL